MTRREYVPRTGPLRVTEIDRAFGHGVARHRIAAGLDQYTLSDMLTAATGWVWTQSLISKIELGNRPVRLSEAYALAAVFDTTVDVLSGRGEGTPKTQAFAQLAEVRRMQTLLRQRERAIVTELKTTTTTTKRNHA